MTNLAQIIIDETPDGWTPDAVNELEEEFVLEDHPSVDPDQSGDLAYEDWSGEFEAE